MTARDEMKVVHRGETVCEQSKSSLHTHMKIWISGRPDIECSVCKCNTGRICVGFVLLMTTTEGQVLSKQNFSNASQAFQPPFPFSFDSLRGSISSHCTSPAPSDVACHGRELTVKCKNVPSFRDGTLSMSDTPVATTGY